MKLLAAAILSIVALTACAPTTNTGEKITEGLSSFNVKLPDGNTVVCVVYDGYKAGGVTCDWDGVK